MVYLWYWSKSYKFQGRPHKTEPGLAGYEGASHQAHDEPQVEGGQTHAGTVDLWELDIAEIIIKLKLLYLHSLWRIVFFLEK